MGQGRKSSRGFTLIAALLIMILLSGVAAGLLFLVTNESKMGGNDLEANLAYFDAESGMEKLTSDLGALYQANMVPTSAQIQALTTNPPSSSMVGVSTFAEQIIYPLGTDASGNPKSGFNTVSAGPNEGLYAEIVPLTMQVQALRPSGATVSMTRSVEVALIPVFQFGVFCGYDCSYFAGPNFSFGGRVHTNSNLFLAAGGDLVFNDKIQAFKQIITDRLENGWPTSSGYTGTVYVPNAAAGCPLSAFPPSGSNCKAMSSGVPGDASWSGGYPMAGSKNNAFPNTTSIGKYNYYLANSLTGVGNLQLPFVQNGCVSNPPPCTDPISIVRKPLAGEAPTSTLGSSRLYNKAQIRILIADTIADLHPERGAGALDAQDVQFPTATTFSGGPFTGAAVTLTAGGTEPVGFATVGSAGWINPYTDAGLRAWGGAMNIPLIGEVTTNPASPSVMTGPWIRVEYCSASPCNVAAHWVGVTQQWLKLGFSRIFNLPPTSPGTNAIDPNAILILQQLRPSVAQAAASAHGTAAAAGGNFYPINFYDAHEGEMRDTAVANSSYTSGANVYTYSSCSVNGIMNAVELDVGNLKRWLSGAIAGSGTSVNYTQNNGYVLYFSDHRGMLPSTHPSNGGQTPAGIVNGESGIEDVINSSQPLTSTSTDGVLEATTYYTYSPEDVDQNGFLDNWGEKNIGYGFGINTSMPLPYSPYKRIAPANTNSPGATSVDCASLNTKTNTLLTGPTDQEGMANPVSGARHVLKLVDGGMSAGLVSNVPVMPAASGCTQSAASPTGCGGFTVASENPVYVQGDYNTTSTDPFWGTATSTTPTQAPHSAASIIADSVTVLSNAWSDMGSLMYPDDISKRAPAADVYYRMAVSGGKNIPFPQPSFAGASRDFGTDGGMHNFLRYLENLGSIRVWYDGSLVSMYYAEYNTGTFKCCATVYNAPTRNFYFDVLFLNPANLPPATPEFQDVVNLSYHQNFTPQ